MAICLLDIDGKLANIALMKLSTNFKSLGETVELRAVPQNKKDFGKFIKDIKSKNYEKIYGSAIFTRSKDICLRLKQEFGDKIDLGGTGWDIKKVLDPKIEHMKPDYDIYTAEMIASRMRGIMTRQRKLEKATEIINSGIGKTSEGCVNECAFCFVPRKEGKFRQASEIKDIINHRSNVIILHDNNLTADPYCIDKLHEIRDRKLIVDINQGCDVRLVNDDIAKALSEVKHLRSIHYAWDLMAFEDKVMEGINILSKYMKNYKHMCFMLVGFNTTFEEDMYRFRKLNEMKIRPYVMVYNEKIDIRLKHFERWVNSMIYKKCEWEDYEPWVRDQVIVNQISFNF